ncbi:MAG: saccharopine dehydrogenase [Alphaproteobacteria bacterium]|nr:saccharopine dehydrogenase [Alphaproteobacteria bacterium]
MRGPILILGGYGNFGKRIATALCRDGYRIIIAGRNKEKAETFAQQLPNGLVQTAIFDVRRELADQLKLIKPSVVINTCGPFQNSDYHIANICIEASLHYIDLADGRDFVTGITQLDEKAKQHHVAIISGASTVPGLSSAVLEHFKKDFSSFDDLTFGISPGQKAERGLATTQAILSYVGKPLKIIAGQKHMRYGWQDIYLQNYPGLGMRWMANCDIPDLDLLPQYYGLKSVRFSAGLELWPLHLGLWIVSWLVRLGLPLYLPHYAEPLLKISNWFDRFGSADGGMHMIISGKNHHGQSHRITWFIIARDGHGPNIPTIPAIILAKKLVDKTFPLEGVMPCLSLVTLEEYLHELSYYSIETVTSLL